MLDGQIILVNNIMESYKKSSEEKVVNMCNKAQIFLGLDRKDEAFELIAIILDYIISGEGLILLENNNLLNELLGQIFELSGNGGTRKIINLVNDTTYDFIWREFRIYTKNNDYINELVREISKNGISRYGLLPQETTYEYIWCEYRKFKDGIQ